MSYRVDRERKNLVTMLKTILPSLPQAVKNRQSLMSTQWIQHKR